MKWIQNTMRWWRQQQTIHRLHCEHDDSCTENAHSLLTTLNAGGNYFSTYHRITKKKKTQFIHQMLQLALHLHFAWYSIRLIRLIYLWNCAYSEFWFESIYFVVLLGEWNFAYSLDSLAVICYHRSFALCSTEKLSNWLKLICIYSVWELNIYNFA